MLAATCLMAVAQSAYAQVAPPFATLLRESEDAPRLAVSEAGVRQAEGLRDQARARPNPSINVMTENVAGSSPYSGFGRAETTLQYSQPIELGGKRSARIAAGEAGVVASRARDRDARVVSPMISHAPTPPPKSVTGALALPKTKSRKRRAT
jgi:cobalt-zinc-cadmium efflux system outer membrane protein